MQAYVDSRNKMSLKKTFWLKTISLSSSLTTYRIKPGNSDIYYLLVYINFQLLLEIISRGMYTYWKLIFSP